MLQWPSLNGGLTCQLQPLDVCINKPFKGYMCGEWNEWMWLPQHESTASGCIKRHTISQVCQWVKNAWDKIKTETVVLSLKKNVTLLITDGTKDDLLYEGNDSSDSTDFEEFMDNSGWQAKFLQLTLVV